MKKAIITTSILALFAGAVFASENMPSYSDNTVVKNKGEPIVPVISGSGDFTSGYDIKNNSLTATSASVNISGYIATLDGDSNLKNWTIDNSTYTVETGDDTNWTAGHIYGGMFAINAGKTAIESSVFSNNVALLYRDNLYTYGAFVNVATGASLETNSLTFTSNTVKREALGRSANVGGALIYTNGNSTHNNLTATSNKIINANITSYEDGSIGYQALNGGILVNAGTTTVTNSNFSKNEIEHTNAYIYGGDIYVSTSGSLSVDGLTSSQNKINSVADSFQVIAGGSMALLNDSTIKNFTAQDNSIVATNARVFGGVIAAVNGTIEISNSKFLKNSIVNTKTSSTSPTISGGVINASNSEVGSGSTSANVVVKNSEFTGNSAEAEHNVDGGVAHVNAGNSLTIVNSSFNNNTAKQHNDYKVRGIVHNRGGTLVLNNVSFNSNATYSTMEGASDAEKAQGIVYLRDTVKSELTDVVFQNNTVNQGHGGAIFMEGSTLDFNVTKNAISVGNVAKNYAGTSEDSRGGFLYMMQGNSVATANFNVAENVTYTIGNGTVNQDSITSAENTAIINKAGAGSLVVNSSMEYFTGTLNVNAGTMEANKGLGATAVNIASGATLNVGLTSTSLTSATVVNDGVLGLKRGTLADGDTLTISSYSGEGTVNAFGGSFADGVFTAGKTATYTSESSAITVGSGETDVQTVSYTGTNNNKLVLDFNVVGKETMTVNSITEVEASESGNIKGEFITGFSVEATYESDLSVVLSAYVGEVLDPAKLLAWHKENGSDVWTQLDGKVEYDASTGLASIFVEGFSSYAFSQVPEPSTYAMIFGAVALSFVAYRRAKVRGRA